MMNEIVIRPSKVVRILLSITIFLLLISLVELSSEYIAGNEKIELVALDEEANVPTWFASTSLFISSILLGIIAFVKKTEQDRYRLHWGVLSLFFLCLSLDETAIIHDKGKVLAYYFDVDGIFHFGWVIAAIPFVIIFFILYLRFLMDLPDKTRGLFVLSGFVYVMGGLGMELVDGWYVSLYGIDNLMYGFMTNVEELFELVGISIFIYALLMYISTHIKEVVIRVSGEK